MLLLTELAGILNDAGVAAAGENLFVNEMPADVEKGVLFLQPLSGFDIDYYLPGYRKGRIEVTVRAATDQAGYELCLEVNKALTVTQKKETASFYLNYVRPVHDPVRFPVSGSDLIEFSLHFDACWVVRDAEALPV